MIVKSFAKINLSLSVNKKLKSGLHNIQSYFCLINLFDEVKIKKIEGLRDIVKFQGKFGKHVEKSNNSILDTLVILRKNKMISNYYSIVIRKRIPVFAGLGGGYLSLVRVPQWTEGMTAGAGWIALALVVFASWQPFRLLIGAYIFGGVTLLQLNLQALGLEINVALLSMSPYLVTIAVLVFMSARRTRGALEAPRSLGKTFFGL